MDASGVPDWVTWLGVAVGSMLGALAIRLGWKSAGGEKTGSAHGKAFTLDAALVDSDSIKKLTAAVEAGTLEMITSRIDQEKSRAAAYRMIEVAGKGVDEISDLRREIGDLAKEIARKR